MSIIDLLINLARAISLAISKIMLIKKKVAINFFRLIL